MNRTQTIGAWCVAAAAYLAIGGVATQIVRASTSVSDQVWSYPWSGEASIPLSASWAIAQTVLVLAILELRRSGLAGPTRAASVGLATAAAGTSLIVVGHLVSIAVRNQSIHATGPEIAGAIFGAGSVLSAAGFLLSGFASARHGRWRGWRRFTLLVTACSSPQSCRSLSASTPRASSHWVSRFAALLPSPRPHLIRSRPSAHEWGIADRP
jgi:hypothetical protein